MLGERMQATCITGHTLLGVGPNQTYPIRSGNCFSVKANDREYRIVNFSLENLEEARRRGVNFPIHIVPLDSHTALIHDERIPNHWYDKEWCEICCPENLLPIQQQLAHDRERLCGFRIERGDWVSYDQSKRPVLPG